MLRTLTLKIFGRRNIPGTYLSADMAKQAVHGNETFAHGFVDNYWSEEIVCKDCKKVFIHTAEEKKHYYEVEGHQFYKKFEYCNDCYAKRSAT
jgi:hypothetical protein